MLGGLGTLGAVQYFFGTEKQYYNRSFIVKKKPDPDDLVEFYGGEGVMEIFCVLPMIHNLLMSTGVWDDNGVYHTFGLPLGTMHASIDFEEKEVDTTGDGEADTINGFNKKELFTDTIFGITLWEMVTNFGFQTLEDGRVMCYQNGESFYGFAPMRLLFQIKSIYDIWACEHHINSSLFGKEGFEEEAQAQAQNIPVHVLQDFLHLLRNDVEKSGGDVTKLQACIAELECRVAQQDQQMQEMRELQQVAFSAGAYSASLRYQKGRGSGTEVRLKVGDKDMEMAIKEALDHVSSHHSNNTWTLRAVTPTWVDGKALPPNSEAWAALLEHPDICDHCKGDADDDAPSTPDALDVTEASESSTPPGANQEVTKAAVDLAAEAK